MYYQQPNCPETKLRIGTGEGLNAEKIIQSISLDFFLHLDLYECDFTVLGVFFVFVQYFDIRKRNVFI